MALGEHDLQAVGERPPLEVGERHRRRAAGRLGHARRPVDGRGHGRQLGPRHRDERVAAGRHPALGGVLDLVRRGREHARQALAVGVGAAEVDVALGQNVALAAEPADPLDAAHEAGPGAGLDARQFGRRRAVAEEPRQLLVQRRLDGLDVGAGAGRHDHVELAADLAALDVGERARRDLVAVDQALVEPRRLAVGEHVGGDRQQVVVRVAGLGHVPDLVDAGLGHAVLRHLAAVGVHGRHPALERGDGRAGLDVAEVARDLLQGHLGRDVARDHDDGVVGPVVGLEPLLDVLQRGRVEVVHRPDDRVVVGVALGVGRVVDQLARHAVGVVLALALLVLDHPALLVQLGLVDGAQQVPHPVGLHEQHRVERADGDVLEVVRPVGVGRAVEVGRADALEHLEVVVVEVLGPVEHQVLEQVREPAPPVRLVFRPDVVPHVDGHDGRLVVLVDDEREPVVERERLVRDVGEAGERVLGRHQRGEDEGERDQ